MHYFNPKNTSICFCFICFIPVGRYGLLGSWLESSGFTGDALKLLQNSYGPFALDISKKKNQKNRKKLVKLKSKTITGKYILIKLVIKWFKISAQFKLNLKTKISH